MTKDEALDLALEVMRNQGDVGVDEWIAAEAAIKQARSAPVQSCYCVNCEAMGKELAALKAQPAPVQPVWIQPDHLQKAQKAPFLCRVEPHKREDFIPLYTTPPAAQRQWVGLTDEEILKLAYPLRWQEVDDFEADKAVNFAQLVEAKLKEKNT